MPNVTQIIRNTARNQKVQQYIVEKDYTLSYLLAAIASTDGLGENLVLKGGTALRKLYFSEYRFSEDLDYSTRVMDRWRKSMRLLSPSSAGWERC